MSLWTPADISTALWLDASDASTLFDVVAGGSLVAADGAVARWEDKSGNARHVTQGAVSKRPLRKTTVQNGLDVVDLDGIDDGMAAAGPLITGSSDFASYYAVSPSNDQGTLSANRLGTDNNRAFWVTDQFVRVSGDGSFGNEVVYSYPSGISSPALLTMRKQGTAYSVRINGSETGSFTGPSSIYSTIEPYAIGLQAASFGIFNPLDGGMFEHLVANDVSAHLIVEGYLAHKWGLAASLPANHPYKTAAPTKGVSSQRRRTQQQIIHGAF